MPDDRYRALVKSVDEGFCVCEALFDENNTFIDCRFLEINPTFEALTGLSQPVGKTVREMVPELEAVWTEAFSRVARARKPIRLKLEAASLGRWFNIHTFPMGEPHSHLFGTLFTVSTARRALEREQDLFLAVGSDLRAIADLDGYFQWVSPTFEQVLGRTAKELTSRPWVEFVHPDDVERTLAEAAKLFSGGETIAFENRYRHKDDSYRWLSWRAQSDSTQQRFYNTAIDVTARKQAEAAIAATLTDTQRLRQLGARLVPETNIQVLYDDIVATAIDLMQAEAGTIQILDEATQSLVLLASKGLDQSMTEHFYRVDASSNTPCGLALASGTRTFVNFKEAKGNDPEGAAQMHMSAGLVCAQSTPLISRTGCPIGMISTYWRQYHRPSEHDLGFLDLLERQATDLIEQRQAKIDLQTSETRLQRAIGIETVGILFFDADGTITGANDTFLQLGGYSRSDLEARRLQWDNLTPPEHMAESKRAIKELEATGRTTPYEKEYFRKDGSRWWGLFAARQLNVGEAVEFVIDVSARKQAEQALEQWAQELNYINQELNQFTHVVAHDLKAPLRAIRNLTQWLQEDLSDRVPPDNQKQLQLINQRVSYMEALINDLLEYSRAGRVEQQVETVDVEALVQDVIASLPVPLGVTIRVATPTPTFDARTVSLKQVFANLISNAIKYGCVEQQGEVTVSAWERSDAYEFAIADRGPGIDLAYHQQVFDNFRHCRSKRTPAARALALQLSKNWLR